MQYAAIPKLNQEYWLPKLERNVARDDSVQREAVSAGWNVIVVWECSIKGKNNNHALELLEKLILSNPAIPSIHNIPALQEEKHV